MGVLSTKASELKAAIEGGLKQLATAIDEQTASAEFKRFLDLQARFHRYSWGNCLLIAMRKPDATMVAGFGQWKRLGRSIKAGEKAIRILAPCPVRRENQKTGDQEDHVFFKSACVFDISQTQGGELPQFEVPEIQGQADALLQKLEAVAAKRGIQVAYRPLAEGHYGNSQGGRIEVSSGYGTAQQAKTLAHELVHEVLHRGPEGSADPGVVREVRELEAEAGAYVICRHFGLDVELRASRYIAIWNGDTKMLSAGLSRISASARKLIEEAENLQGSPAVRASEPSCMSAAA